MSLNVKVKGQGHQEQKTRCALRTPQWCGRSGMPSIVADNVAQAAGETIRSLQRGNFSGMRALGLAGYRWALPRISSYYILRES